MTIQRISLIDYSFGGLGPIGKYLTLNTDQGSIDCLYIANGGNYGAVVWAGS